MRNLSQEGLRAIDVPWPDLALRTETLARIDRAFAWVERLSVEASNASKLIDCLDQAVLSKAFRGELVPQDPNDEPASVLLERIKVERVSPSSTGKRRGRPRAATLL